MKSHFRSFIRTAALAGVVAGLAAACGGGGDQGGTATGTAAQINGAGATFPYPIYSKWFAEYNRLHPNVRINYQSQGSGAGIRQLTSRTVFFGASDQPMKDAQLEAAPGPILHLPTVLGAVVPVYNLPGVSGELKFTGPLLADIVLGKVTRWNDPAIATLNPGVTLPETAITFVHRSDGSGTTFVWADYLSKVSPEFKEKVGADSSLKWPVGIGGKGNEGVAGMVSQTPGSLGYVELIYALQNKINYGEVKNSAGNFVKASIEGVTASAASVKEMPADYRISITNAPGANAYPISSFTYLLIPTTGTDQAKRKVLKDMLSWVIKSGESQASQLSYAPLPEGLQQKVLNTIYALQ